MCPWCTTSRPVRLSRLVSRPCTDYLELTLGVRRPCREIASRGGSRLCGANLASPQGEMPGSRLACYAAILWCPNSASPGRLRHDRVSHLGAHAAQEAGHLAGGDRPRRGPGPGRLHVVLVVRPGHGPVPAPPPATARGMPCPLAGRGPAGPLAEPQAGIGMEEGLTARAAPAPDSGHRVTSQVEAHTLPQPSGPRSAWISKGVSRTTEAGFSLRGTTRTTISGNDADPSLHGHGYCYRGGKWSRRKRCAHTLD